MTKAFESINSKPFLNGRVKQTLHRIQTFTYNHNTFEVAQYRITIKDSGRHLTYAAVVTFINDLPDSQKQFELPATGYAFATQWLVAVEAAYDAAS